MSKRRDKAIQKNSEKLSHDILVNEYSSTKEILIKKLNERKKAYTEFLSRIECFIEYAKCQAKNNEDYELRIKYLETVKEEESLRDKILEYLKKNDELIESIQKV